MSYFTTQITVLVVSQLLFSRFAHSATFDFTNLNLYDRDPHDNVTEYCQTNCNDVCEKCQEPVTCNNETETQCGEYAALPVFGVEICPPHAFCVLNEYKCPDEKPDGEYCPLVMWMDCADDQRLCPGIPDEDGCEGQETCVPRGVDTNGDMCEGVCAKVCDETQMLCVEPHDVQEGCAKDTMCVAKATDSHGHECDVQQCPLNCADNEITCSGSEDIFGCKEEDICVERGTRNFWVDTAAAMYEDNDDFLCTGICPVECDPITQVKCESQVEPDGCKTQETCHQKARNSNGEFCPDRSDSHGCPILCPEDEILCAAKIDALGCLEQATCYDITQDREGNECLPTSICPTPCEPHQISCPGGVEENGCKKPDVCINQEHDFYGNLCPSNCPAICGDNQIACEGHVDENNCQTPETCHEIGTKTEGNDVGGMCPAYCPAICKQGEVLCSSQVDCDGCLTQEFCRPKATNMYGQACPDDSDSHGCPVQCNEEIGEILCPAHEDYLGCKPKAQCMQRPLDIEDEWCPSSSVCEAAPCRDSEMMCPTGFDNMGCRLATHTCEPRFVHNNDYFRGLDLTQHLHWLMTHYYDEQEDYSDYGSGYSYDYAGAIDTFQVCANHCPATCAPDEYECDGSKDHRGCAGASTCNKRAKDFNDDFCDDVCPVQCHKGTIKRDGGVSEFGCQLQDHCLECARVEIGDNWGDYDGSGGSDYSSTVTKNVTEGVVCPSYVDSSSHNWAGDEWYFSDETFAITQTGNTVTVERTDSGADLTSGWKTNLIIYCCPGDLDSNPVRAPPVPAVAPPLDVTEPVELAVDPTVEP